MAARLKPHHQEDVKAKIQTSQLINRLQNHIDGTLEMTSTQIDAAKFLINKTVSNAPTVNDTTMTHDVTPEAHRLIFG